MIPVFQIPRNSLLWLMAAQALLIFPHLPRLPVWLLVAWLITALWRIQIFRGVWAFPGRWVKGLIVALCLAGLLTEYRRFLGIEPMVGLLVTAFLLKLLEMRSKRDALIVVFLGYFVAATQFLFSQTILTALYITLTVITLTTALLGLHQTAGHRYPARSFLLAGSLIGQSIPLMLVLFLIVPRIGSLWAVPQNERAAKTGVSDSMMPGDFSNLVQDGSTAFRVTFDGDIPPPPFLYWRGLVLSDFDGRRWSQARLRGQDGSAVNWYGEMPAPWRQSVETAGEGLSYEVIMEPTQQHWLYALPTPQAVEEGIGLSRDYRLVSRLPITYRYQYQVLSRLNYRTDAKGLSEQARLRELALPPRANPRAVQQAQDWLAESESPRAYIDRVLGFFNRSFTYTLSPPTLGLHPVDDFLWQTQAGFCEHFASAFVVMMRAAGIPARVVVGYQGGKINPLKNFLVVRQSDAHAWSEVWLEGEGWVRVDPTAAVAPERIESGLEGALGAEQSALLDDPFSLQSYRGTPLFSNLLLRLEVLEYDWHRLVMGYDQDRQNSFLHKLLGSITPLRIAIFLLGSGTVLLLIIGASLAMGARGPRRDPADKLYRRFLKVLDKHGIERQQTEGPRGLSERVRAQRPDLFPWTEQVTGCYERYTYAGEQEQIIHLRRFLKQGPRRR